MKMIQFTDQSSKWIKNSHPLHFSSFYFSNGKWQNYHWLEAFTLKMYKNIFNRFQALWQPFASDFGVSTHFPFQLYRISYVSPRNPCFVCRQLKNGATCGFCSIHIHFHFLLNSKANDERTNERQSGHFMPSFELLSSIKTNTPLNR